MPLRKLFYLGAIILLARKLLEAGSTIPRGNISGMNVQTSASAKNDQAGTTSPPIKTIFDLYNEPACRDDLFPRFYIHFHKGYLYQMAKKYDLARTEYLVLKQSRFISEPDKDRDLTIHSEAVKHNLKLLDETVPPVRR